MNLFIYTLLLFGETKSKASSFVSSFLTLKTKRKLIFNLQMIPRMIYWCIVLFTFEEVNISFRELCYKRTVNFLFVTDNRFI